MVASILARLKDHLLLSPDPPAPAPDLVAAGVLVPLFVAEEEFQVLFIQRTLMVKDHRGQIAFPGGVRDPEDAHLLATALRETEEEIGLAPGAVEVLGTLPPVATITGYHITPFVGLIPHPYDFHPSPREVKRLLTLPVDGVLPPGTLALRPLRFPGPHHPGVLLAERPGGGLGRHRPHPVEPAGPPGGPPHTGRPRCHLSGLTWQAPRRWYKTGTWWPWAATPGPRPWP